MLLCPFDSNLGSSGFQLPFQAACGGNDLTEVFPSARFLMIEANALHRPELQRVGAWPGSAQVSSRVQRESHRAPLLVSWLEPDELRRVQCGSTHVLPVLPKGT